MHWFNPAALNRPLARSSVLPGQQGFATAKATDEELGGLLGLGVMESWVMDKVFTQMENFV